MHAPKMRSRLVRVGSILLLFVCLGLVGGGLIRIFNHLATPLGWTMLASGLLLTFATINQWGRILSGVFGVAAVNALISLWSGHQINQPTAVMPRSVAIILALVFFSAALLSSKVAVRQFHTIDRTFLLCVFLLLLIAMINNRFAIPGALGALFCLLLLWRLPGLTCGT